MFHHAASLLCCSKLVKHCRFVKYEGCDLHGMNGDETLSFSNELSGRRNAKISSFLFHKC